MKKADECKMFQSNEMLENQFFVNILGNWSAARVKIIQKEPLRTNFDEIHHTLEYYDYSDVLPCFLFQLTLLHSHINPSGLSLWVFCLIILIVTETEPEQ